MYPHDELFLLIGADQANLFHKWQNPDEIAALAYSFSFIDVREVILTKVTLIRTRC